MENQFNTDTKALGVREILNQSATHNLEDWMLQYMDPFPGMQVLDIGCGRGKQVFFVKDQISADGSIIGIDASQEAVDLVNSKASEAGAANISARCLMIDEVPETFERGQFDRIISSYAIYYSSDLKKLLINLKKLLKDNGQMLLCGYASGSNQEMIDLVNEVSGEKTLPNVDDYISEPDIRKVGEHFSKSDTYRLDNKITFYTAEDLLAWWKNHNTFVPSLTDIVSQRVHNHFKEHSNFLLSKNVLAVRFWR